MNINHSIQGNVVLHLKIEDQFFRVLQIPKSSIPFYTLKPYKWLRFLGYIIYGDLTPGIIACSEDGEAVSDDLMEIGILEHDNIYYLPSGAPRLLDPAALGRGFPSSQTSCSHSNRSASMSQKVCTRDDERCVLSGADSVLDVCHLIPRVKGPEYIKHVTRNRGDIGGAGDEITSIDDIRNQITLNPGTHWELDKGFLAFLLTPNECLSRDDIPQPTLESRATRGRRPDDNTFLTVHYFPHPLDSTSADRAPQNCDIWQPTEKNKWPTRTIFNFVYARAVFNRWAHPENLTGYDPVDDDISLSESDSFYFMGPVDILWSIVMGSRRERGDLTAMPYSKDVALENKVEAWRHGVTTASD